MTANDAQGYGIALPVHTAMQFIVEQKIGTLPPVYVRATTTPVTIPLGLGGAFTAVVTAHITGPNATAGQTVHFSTNFGALSADTATTDTNGLASVTVTLDQAGLSSYHCRQMYMTGLEVAAVFGTFIGMDSAPILGNGSISDLTSAFAITATPNTRRPMVSALHS